LARQRRILKTPIHAPLSGGTTREGDDR